MGRAAVRVDPVVRRLAILVTVVAVLVGAPLLLRWYRTLGWIDEGGPCCWVHVDLPDGASLDGRWRYAFETPDVWRDMGVRHHRGAPRYLRIFPIVDLSELPLKPGWPTMPHDELIEVVVTVDGEQVHARGGMRANGHYRLVGDAIEPEPSLWGVPLYAWVPW